MLGAESLAGAGEQRRVYNWNDIRRDIDNETPKMEDFAGGDPYSDEEVAHDLARIREIESRLKFQKSGRLSDSEVQEYATVQEIGEMDWFGEDDRGDQLFPNGEGRQLVAFMTSKFDDMMSHVDAVCVMENADTDFRPIPFALDLTYNGDQDILDHNFQLYSPSAAVPGFCSVKYFEDTFSYGEPLLPKGRIDSMPRFIVGFSPELSKEITEQRMTNTGGWGNLRREVSSSEAKFCVLRELEQQSQQMLDYLNDPEKIKGKNLKTIENMRRDVAALSRYFRGALQVARENDPNGRYEKYSNRDTVFREIISRDIMNTRAGGV